IRKHLQNEQFRWKAEVTKGPVVAAPLGLMVMPSGLGPSDVGKLEGAWKAAIVGRIAELESAVG
ncbi:MAG: hypothetical protein WCI05_14175, partial [Myxococcales bacterium]